MGDPKENPARLFEENERVQKGKLEDSLPVVAEADLHHEENKRKEISPILQLNMEKTKEEFEILYTRL